MEDDFDIFGNFSEIGSHLSAGVPDVQATTKRDATLDRVLAELSSKEEGVHVDETHSPSEEISNIKPEAHISLPSPSEVELHQAQTTCEVTETANAEECNGQSHGRGYGRGRCRIRGRRRGIGYDVSTCATDGNTDIQRVQWPLSHTSQSERTTRGVMRARRQFLAEKAARSTTVDCVDLVSSPIVRVEGMISLDSDEEDLTSPQATKKNTLECSFDEDNPEISVKLIWKSIPQCFKLRKHQKFSNLLNEFAKRENIEVDCLVLDMNEKIISPNETPANINYKIYQFLNLRQVNHKVKLHSNTRKQFDRNTITLKIQSDKFKRPFQFDLHKSEKFKILYIKCSEELNIPSEDIKLCFDAERLDYNSTPGDLEFEGDEIIDLFIVH